MTSAPGEIRTPDTQFRRLVVQGVAACSPLFVKVRIWPESTRFLRPPTTATECEYRRTTKKDAKRMHVGQLLGWHDGFRCQGITSFTKRRSPKLANVRTWRSQAKKWEGSNVGDRA